MSPKMAVVLRTSRLTFSLHAGLETLAEAAVLALVAVMLVDRTVTSRATRVRQISTDRAFEETLASLARVLAVVLTGALVTADDALGRRHSLLLLLLLVMLVMMSARFDSDASVWNALDGRQRRPLMMRSMMRK